VGWGEPENNTENSDGWELEEAEEEEDEMETIDTNGGWGPENNNTICWESEEEEEEEEEEEMNDSDEMLWMAALETENTLLRTQQGLFAIFNFILKYFVLTTISKTK
jgi:hypothetical protein